MNPFLAQALLSMVPVVVPVVTGYGIYAVERLLKIKLDASARAALDSAMQNGADWIIHEGRAPTPTEVLDYVRRPVPGAMKRFDLDGAARSIAIDRAKAVIARSITAATNGAIETAVAPPLARAKG